MEEQHVKSGWSTTTPGGVKLFTTLLLRAAMLACFRCFRETMDAALQLQNGDAAYYRMHHLIHDRENQEQSGFYCQGLRTPFQLPMRWLCCPETLVTLFYIVVG